MTIAVRRSELVLGVLAAPVFLAAGAAIASRAVFALILIAVVVAIWIALRLPDGVLFFVLLAVTCVVPALLAASPLSGAGVIAGQATVVATVGALCLIRTISRRVAFDVPTAVWAAYGCLASVLAIEAGVGAVRGTLYAGFSSDLLRQLAYPLAALIGAYVVASSTFTGFETRLLGLARGGAVAATGAGVGAVLYWLDSSGRLATPLLHGVFGDVSRQSAYHARSVFPLALDSPNVGATVLVGIGAFAVPPLFLGTRRDRHLAYLTALAVVGGVLASQSRTGLLALAAAPWPLIALSRAETRRRVILTLAVLAAFAFQGYRLLPATRHFSSHSGTFVARQSIWAEAGHVFLDSPALGRGYHFSARPNFQEAATPGGAPVDRLQSAQNEYLGWAVDGGGVAVVGLMVLMSCFVSPARTLLRGDRLQRSLAAGYLGLLAAYSIAMFGSAVLQSAAASTVIWAAFGVTAAAARVGREA
jgi:hypothetical protein